MPRLDPAFETTLREALADPNASYTDIAAKVGRAATTIKYHARRWGMERGTRDRITDDQRDKIHRMLHAGCWTYQQIADGTGCSTKPVQEAARRLGIAAEHRRPLQFQRKDQSD